MKKRVYTDGVNYLQGHSNRKRLTHYLKAGGFKKIGGARIYGATVGRRRAVLDAFAAIILLIGMYYVFF